MAMPPPAGTMPAGDGPLQYADHHRVTQELLTGQLRKAQERVMVGLNQALQQLRAQHEEALALLAERYSDSLSAAFHPQYSTGDALSPLTVDPPPPLYLANDVAVVPREMLSVRPPPEAIPERPQTRDQQHMPGIVVEEVFDVGEVERPGTESHGMMRFGSISSGDSFEGARHADSRGLDMEKQQTEETSSTSFNQQQGAWSTNLSNPKTLQKASVTPRTGPKGINGHGSMKVGSSYLHSRLLEVWTVKDGEEIGSTDPRALFKSDAKKPNLVKSPSNTSGLGGYDNSTHFVGWSAMEAREDVFNSDTRCGKMVIHPYHPGRSVWDIVSLILVLYDMVMIPFNFFEPEETAGMIFMEWLTRFFWSFDMPLSFISGYVTFQGSIELRPGPICKKYVRSWFILDAIVVGVDWFEVVMSAAAEGLGFARFGKASRVFRILRMIRLLRLARMTEVLNLLTERLDSEKLVILIDVIKLVIIMLGSGHMIACLFYAIGNATSSDLAWLAQYTYNNEDPYKDAPLEFRYIMSLRWAISQFAGGMDEVTPVSFAENVYAVFVYLGAFWSGAVFVSILTSSMTQWYIIGSQQSQQLTVLRRYLSQNGISKKLALRVQRNAKHSLDEQQREMPEHAVSLINSVSEPLRVELHFEMYCSVITQHPFFARYCEECPHVVRKICHIAMFVSQVSTGDTIFNNGEKPDNPHMRILSRGRLRFSFKKEFVTVESGTCISEPHLWVEWSHKGEMVACEDCRIHLICAKEFQMIVSQFEHVGFEPRAYARLYVDCLNAIPEDELSDLPNEDMMHNFKMLLTTRAMSSDNLDSMLASTETPQGRFTHGLPIPGGIGIVPAGIANLVPGRGSVMPGRDSDRQTMSQTGSHIRQAFINHLKRGSIPQESRQSMPHMSHVKSLSSVPGTHLPKSGTRQGSKESKELRMRDRLGHEFPEQSLTLAEESLTSETLGGQMSTESRSFLQPIVCN